MTKDKDKGAAYDAAVKRALEVLEHPCRLCFSNMPINATPDDRCTTHGRPFLYGVGRVLS